MRRLLKCSRIASMAAVAAMCTTAVSLGQDGARADRATRTADSQQGQQQTEQLTKFFAGELMLANKGEIELSKIAAEQSSNQQVKQFAQMLIEDHSALNDKLAQIAPEMASMITGKGSATRGESTQSNRREGGADRATARAGSGSREDDMAMKKGPLMKVCKINMEACEHHLQMAKQMLKNYQGQDFDMAFLGMQIGNHTWMLAKLEALGDVGSNEFQQCVQDATPTIEQHLEKAKQLAKQLEDDRQSS